MDLNHSPLTMDGQLELPHVLRFHCDSPPRLLEFILTFPRASASEGPIASAKLVVGAGSLPVSVLLLNGRDTLLLGCNGPVKASQHV